VTLRDLLVTLRGFSSRRASAPAPRRPLTALDLLQARWDRERPTAPEEQEPPIVYTRPSALVWLERAELHHQRPVSTAEILQHCAKIKHPTKRACQLLAETLKRAGARSERKKGQTHLRWSIR
jgi:hypothetical protein